MANSLSSTLNKKQNSFQLLLTIKQNVISNQKSHCSLNYHHFKFPEIETFAHGVSTGIYSHKPPFDTPPLSKADFDNLVDAYHDTYEKYKNGGKSQKGDFIIAKTNLMAALDNTADYVDALSGVDDGMIILAGYTPTKTGDTKAVIPAVPTGVVITRGVTGELFAECKAETGAAFYGCIMVAGGPLPSGVAMNGAGQLIAVNQKDNSNLNPNAIQNAIVVAIDLTKSRKKQFNGLVKGVEYFFYFYAGNTAGISQLSEVQSLMCG